MQLECLSTQLDGRLTDTIILDGGLSTQLERHHGIDLTAHPRLWTAGLLSTSEGRAALRAAHVAFARAGADVVLSATYQAFEPGVCVRDMQAGVDIAVRAARDASVLEQRPVQAWISVGAFGATLADGSEYTGRYDGAARLRGLDAGSAEEALFTFHEQRLAVLLAADEAGSAGGIAFETIPSAAEARALARLALAPRLAAVPLWIALQCRDGAHLADGTPLAPLAAELCALLAARSDGVLTGLGANCVPVERCDELIGTLVEAAQGARGRAGPRAGVNAVCLYPNDGGVWDATTRCWACRTGPSYARAHAPRWREQIVRAGLVAVIGGCCSVDEAVVRELREALFDITKIHARVNPAPSPGRTHASRPRQWTPNSRPESFGI
jgi:homocysteine S-methyltransferase